MHKALWRRLGPRVGGNTPSTGSTRGSSSNESQTHDRRHRPPLARRVLVLPGFALACIFFLIVLSVKYKRTNVEQQLQAGVRQTTVQSFMRVEYGLVGLLRRNAPVVDHQLFTFRLINNQDYASTAGAGDEQNENRDWAKWEFNSETQGAVTILGTSVSSMARMLADFYLEQCGIELVSWAATSNQSESPNQQQRKNNNQEHTKHISCTQALTRMPHRSQKISSQIPWRYYWNQVTTGYSTVWWGWERWERELDWMSLRGINVALAHVGQEAIWRRVLLRDYGVDTATDFLTSEVYLSWHRMGNLKKVGGPPSDEWLDSHVRLQHLILRRMRELGIRPILPSFNGFVPDAVAQKLNEWPCVRADNWFGFSPPNTAVCRLQVTNPHFSHIGRAITQETLKEYEVELGLYETDSIRHGDILPLLFSADVFNEMDPSESTDVNMVMKLLYDVVAEPVTATLGTAQAKEKSLSVMLVMQMWCFAHSREVWTAARVKSFLSGAPTGGVLLLDLHAEKRPQWIRLRSVLESINAQVVWTMLHNFGRSDGIGGEAHVVVEGLNKALQEAPELIKGVGVAMEGIEQNEMLYALVFALVWERGDILQREGITQLNSNVPGSGEWLRVWAAGRYHLGRGHPGQSGTIQAVDTQREKEVSAGVASAWQCAMDTAYGRGVGEWEGKGGWGPPKSVIELRPRFGLRSGSFQPTKVYYNTPNAFTFCTRQLIAAATTRLHYLTPNTDEKKRRGSSKDDNGVRALAYDVVDFARQAVSDAALVISEQLDAIFQSKKLKEEKAKLFERSAQRMLDLVSLLDDLLEAHPRWREEAAWCPHTVTVAQRQQQRTMVTEWNEGTGSLHSYASRQIAGLTKNIYLVRWRKWFEMLKRSMSDSAYIRSKQEHRLHVEFVILEREWAKSVAPVVSCTKYGEETEDDALELLRTVLTVVNKLDPLLLSDT